MSFHTLHSRTSVKFINSNNYSKLLLGYNLDRKCSSCPAGQKQYREYFVVFNGMTNKTKKVSESSAKKIIRFEVLL